MQGTAFSSRPIELTYIVSAQSNHQIVSYTHLLIALSGQTSMYKFSEYSIGQAQTLADSYHIQEAVQFRYTSQSAARMFRVSTSFRPHMPP